MMILINNYVRVFTSLALVMFLTMPIKTWGQIPIWLGKDSEKELKAIEVWQKDLQKKESLISQRDSLYTEVKKQRQTKGDFIRRKQELQDRLDAMAIDANGRTRPTDQIYFQYDTVMLKIHQGHYGDERIEQQQQAMLVCHRAEDVLSRPFNKKEVQKALDDLNKVQELLPKVAQDVAGRLKQFEKESKNLRTSLTNANAIRPNSDPDRSGHRVTRYTKEFFNKLEEGLNPDLLNPDKYPYLHAILIEAISSKMEDPSNDITEIINKL